MPARKPGKKKGAMRVLARHSFSTLFIQKGVVVGWCGLKWGVGEVLGVGSAGGTPTPYGALLSVL